LLPINLVFGQQVPDKDFPVSDGTLIYHPRSNAVLISRRLFAPPDLIQSDVWKWDGKKWSQIKAAGPGSRDFFTGALNTKTGNIQFLEVLMLKKKQKDDMWSFDGLKWDK
jgi:hypothetical protein